VYASQDSKKKYIVFFYHTKRLPRTDFESHLRSKTLNMILLLLQYARRNKKWEVAVLDVHFLYFSIKECLHIGIDVRLNHTTKSEKEEEEEKQKEDFKRNAHNFHFHTKKEKKGPLLRKPIATARGGFKFISETTTCRGNFNKE
jgi:hypothetical protein